MAGFASTVRFARSTVTGAALGAIPRTGERLRRLDFGPFEDALAGLDPARERQLAGLVDAASLSGLGPLLDSGRLSATELTLLYLARIRRGDETLRSVVELNPLVLADAHAADRRRGDGAARGPLDGVPLTLKDNIETTGPLHTTGGAVVLGDHVAARDATIVTALRRAGAVILGKNNLSEFAGAHCHVPGFSAVGGQTINPHGRCFGTGGSSSGSAVAVAAGFCAASVGTETSGSLTSPAAASGLVGVKPSRGVLSTRGIIPLISYQDAPGPLARTVRDAALLLEALGGPAPDLPKDALAGVRVGVLAADILGDARRRGDAGGNHHLLERIRDGLAAAGARVADATVVRTEPAAAYRTGYLRLVLNGLAHETMGYLAGAGAPASSLDGLVAYNLAESRVRMPKGQAYLNLALLWERGRDGYARAALDYRERATAILDATFRVCGAEVLVSLSSLHSCLYAVAGLPAVTVPLGLRPNGMPAGATLIGRLGDDARLLGFAAAFERGLVAGNRAGGGRQVSSACAS